MQAGHGSEKCLSPVDLVVACYHLVESEALARFKPPVDFEKRSVGLEHVQKCVETLVAPSAKMHMEYVGLWPGW